MSFPNKLEVQRDMGGWPELVCLGVGLVGQIVRYDDAVFIANACNAAAPAAPVASGLPTWDEAAADVAADTATPVDAFIHEQEPDAPFDVLFRKQLSDALEYVAACARPAAAPVAAPAPSELTDEDIDAIWQTMPGGPAGWFKSFGYQQFAREIEAAILDGAPDPFAGIAADFASPDMLTTKEPPCANT